MTLGPMYFHPRKLKLTSPLRSKACAYRMKWTKYPWLGKMEDDVFHVL